VRRSLKQEFQAKATLRDVSHMKVIEYDAGKPKKVRKCPSMMTRLLEFTFTYVLLKGCSRAANVAFHTFAMHLTNAISSHALGALIFFPSANSPHAYGQRPFFRPSSFTTATYAAIFVFLFFCLPVTLVRVVNGVCDFQFASLWRIFSLSGNGFMGEAAVKTN
jgi:hypothetical protein